MNINDVKSTAIPKDRLEAIFARQHELMKKYVQIEANNGLLLTDAVPVDLHDRYGQARLKDFAWRVTEELAEAVETLSSSATFSALSAHFLEEVADALHFLVELCILSGVGPKELVDCPPTQPDRLAFVLTLFELTDRVQPRPHTSIEIEQAAGKVVWTLGQAMNCLKNKPWKVTHMLTDVARYKELLQRAFWAFCHFLVVAGIDADTITDVYFRKSEVNKFRQDSNY